MANVHDVAAYILAQKGPMTAMKLQKLIYYCQAWSLVWDDAPLFPEPIEAWANGPVVPELYQRHRGIYELVAWPDGHPENLSPTQAETVDAVLSFYGDRSSAWLSELTHREQPWMTARKGMDPGERGNQKISLASMAEYYEGLLVPGE